MTTFIFVRHGESETNRTKKFAGQANPSLTEKGLRQAEQMAQWLAANYCVDHIYSSDLLRAYQTADAFAKRTGGKVLENAAFREINGGAWHEQTYAYIQKNYPEEYRIWINDVVNAKLPGGESTKALAKRVIDEVFRLKQAHPGKTIAVFTHATPIRLLVAYLKTGDLNSANQMFTISNASTTVVQLTEDKAVFQVLDYDDYLEEKTCLPGIV